MPWLLGESFGYTTSGSLYVLQSGAYPDCGDSRMVGKLWLRMAMSRWRWLDVDKGFKLH